jgi:hypothetical protein
MSIRDYVDFGYVLPGYVVDPVPVVSEFDPGVTVASQYANSPTLRQMVDLMAQYFDPSTDFGNFYDAVWNIETATGFGLDFWGKVVNVQRVLTIPGNLVYFGFAEQGVNAQPFNQAPMYDGVKVTQSYSLTDSAYRNLILMKALANISRGSAQSINTLLRGLFAGRGRCYVTDQGNMQMMYTFEFNLQPYEIAIMTQSGVIPKPAGVRVAVTQLDASTTFGFAEAVGSQPFNQGVFFNPDVGVIPVTQ